MKLTLQALNSDAEITPYVALELRNHFAGVLASPWVVERFTSPLPSDRNVSATRDTAYTVRRMIQHSEVVIWKNDLWNACMNGAQVFFDQTINGQWINTWQEGRVQLWIFSPSHVLEAAWKSHYQDR